MSMGVLVVQLYTIYLLKGHWYCMLISLYYPGWAAINQFFLLVPSGVVSAFYNYISNKLGRNGHVYKVKFQLAYL